jgi:hypothetical protein
MVGKNVKGQVHLADLFTQRGVKRMIHFAGKYLNNRCLGQRNLGENHSDDCSVPVPPLNVRLSRSTGQRISDLLDGASLQSVFQKALRLDKHQYQPPAGTLCPVPFQAEHFGEEPLWKDVNPALGVNSEKTTGVGRGRRFPRSQ